MNTDRRLLLRGLVAAPFVVLDRKILMPVRGIIMPVELPPPPIVVPAPTNLLDAIRANLEDIGIPCTTIRIQPEARRPA